MKIKFLVVYLVNFGNNPKIELAQNIISNDNEGTLWTLDTSDENQSKIEDMFNKIAKFIEK